MSAREEFSDREFVAGSLTGLRSFRVDSLGRLTAVTNGAVWRPGVNEAECRRDNYIGVFLPSRFTFSLSSALSGVATPEVEAKKDDEKKREHRVGQLNCECGFYAYHDTAANPYRERDDVVVGLIEGFGSVTVGARGFRASKAQLVALVGDGKPTPWFRRLTRRGVFTAALLPINAWSVAQHLMRHGVDTTAWVLFGITVAWITAVVATLIWQRAIYIRPEQKPIPAAVLRNYPELPVYRTVREAVAAHPLTPPPPPVEPTPDTDPEFWTRSAR